jgi:hypothetical protein
MTFNGRIWKRFTLQLSPKYSDLPSDRLPATIISVLIMNL